MVFFFYGDNSYAIAQAIAQIRAQYEQKTGGLLDVQTFDMADTPLTDLLDALATRPMFAGSRLLVVRGLGSNKTANAQIADIVEVVPKSSVVVLVDSEVDRRSSYFRTLAAGKNAREFMPLEPAKLRAWIKQTVESLGGIIESLAVQKLYETVAHEYRPRDRAMMKRAGADQWQLAEEIKKLIGYNPAITLETIADLVVPNIEQTIFELVDAVARGHSAEALRIYQNLITHGASDQQILAMLNWQYRNIVLARENIGADSKWTYEFGISPFVASKAATLGNTLSFEQLQAAYRLMIEADMSIKTGDKPSALALEQLIYQMCQVSA